MQSAEGPPASRPPQQQLPPRVGWFRRLVADILFVTNRDNKWWLLPLIIVLLIMAGLLAFVLIAGPLAPFLYPVI